MPSETVAFDTSVVLDWLLDRVAEKGESAISHLKSMIAQMEAGGLTIAVSNVVKIEILPSKNRPEYQRFLNLFHNPDFQSVSINKTVVDWSLELRDDRAQKFASQKHYQTVDMIHVASALYARASVLYTTDSGIVTPTEITLRGRTLRVERPYLPPPNQFDLFAATPL